MIKGILVTLGIAFGLITPRPEFTTWHDMVNWYDAPIDEEQHEWDMYYAEALTEYEDEFTALFNSYETKRAKNGALMIRQGNTGSFKFAKKG